MPVRSAVGSGIVAAPPEQIHGIGENLGSEPLVIVLVHPIAGTQTPLDINLRPLVGRMNGGSQTHVSVESEAKIFTV